LKIYAIFIRRVVIESRNNSSLRHVVHMLTMGCTPTGAIRFFCEVKLELEVKLSLEN